VPNGGFENWTTGNPNNWLVNNFPGFAVPVTQATPPYSGTYGARGEVLNAGGSPYSPLLASTDASGNGFPVSQSYATFSFYYKMNVSGTAAFEAIASFYDAGNNYVGGGGQMLTGAAASYTQASFPIAYIGSNPVECIILFSIVDSVTTNPPVGDFFVVDAVSLSGVTGLPQAIGAHARATVYPNPADGSVFVSLPESYNGSALVAAHDNLGRRVAASNAEFVSGASQEPVLDCAAWPPGVYTVRIEANERIWHTVLIKH
jgi:hypothetical protein